MTSYFGSKLFLLPNYFKKIGLGLVLTCILGMVSILVFDIKLSEEYRLLLKQLIHSPFLLGLAIIGISKDKVEDELTMFIRLKAILWAFFYVTLFVVFMPFINLIEEKETVYSAEYIISMMLIGYLLMYYYQKLRR
jgi:hypothetical protein